MTELHKILGVSQRASALMQEFGICGNRNVSNLKDEIEARSKFLNGVHLIKFAWGLIIVVFDNIGFHIRGAQAGYDQYILILFIVISYKELKQVGFYTADREKRISRERKVWAEIRNGYTPAMLVANQKDYDALGTRTPLETIEYLLEIHNDLPTYEDCVEIERRSTMKTDMKWNKKREMKIEFGKRMAWHSKTVVAEVDESEEDGDEDLPPQDDMEDEEVEKEIMGTRTLHDANDVQMDVPMHADLNSTSVTVGIMRMTENYMYKALSKPNPHVDEEDTIAMIEERLKIEREKKRSMGARIQ